MIVVTINPNTRTAMKIVPFVFGASKLAVIPGGGSATVTVDTRKAVRSRYVMVVEAAAVAEAMLGTAGGEVKMAMRMRR